MEALDRFADLGVDGFRFDLASVLARDPGVRPRASATGRERRGVRLVAEPWDIARYLRRAGVPRTIAGCSGTTGSATTCAASCAASPDWSRP